MLLGTHGDWVCAGSSRDPPEKQAPMCTLHSFPHNIDHCLTFARSEFEGLLEKVQQEANAFLSDPTKYLAAIRTVSHSDCTLVTSGSWSIFAGVTLKALPGPCWCLCCQLKPKRDAMFVQGHCAHCMAVQLQHVGLRAQASDAAAREQLEKVVEALVTDRCRTFEDCIAWARMRFQVSPHMACQTARMP